MLQTENITMNILLPIYGFEIKTRYEALESILGTQKTQKRFLELHFPTKWVDFSQSYKQRFSYSANRFVENVEMDSLAQQRRQGCCNTRQQHVFLLQ